MYIFVPQGQPNAQSNQENPFYNGFMDVINIASFLIGLQNLDLNITAKDIDNQTQAILDDLHGYLDKQDKHLTEQDKHLLSQDIRLDRLERLMYDKDMLARKESKR